MADCLIQFAGDTFCKGYSPAASLTPGVEIPPDATWAPWIQMNGDNNANNYKIVNGCCVYIPAIAPNVNRVNGTSGQFYWIQGVGHGGKEILAAFNGYTQASTSIVFPVPFLVTPSVISNTLTGVSGVTLTKTGITFGANNVSGTVVIKGI